MSELHYVKAFADGIDPMVDANGVPICTTDECASFDGKRCKLIGSRPSHICEPAVMDLASRARIQIEAGQ